MRASYENAFWQFRHFRYNSMQLNLPQSGKYKGSSTENAQRARMLQLLFFARRIRGSYFVTAVAAVCIFSSTFTK
jgi:hypothetical protein